MDQNLTNEQNLNNNQNGAVQQGNPANGGNPGPAPNGYPAGYGYQYNNGYPERNDGGPEKFFAAVLLGMFIAVVVLYGVRFSINTLRKVGFLKNPNKVTVSGDTALDQETLDKIRVLEESIDEYYYKTDIDREKEKNSIYKGVVASLEDPYSEYYTEEEYKELLEDTKGIYYGIGAYVTMDKQLNLPRITGTIEGSPAEASGLKSGDIIEKVDDESVQGLTLSEVVKKIHGEMGTVVKITVYREGESEDLDFDVTRDEVKAQTVNTTMLENNIGYLGITEFDSVTPEQFSKGMEDLRSQDMKALIIDLRSNPGGNLSAVVDIANQLLPAGNVVYTLDRDGNKEEYKSDGLHEIDIPLAVLVNGYSASASEILSGAIKDYDKGVLVGETTYGKGVVQRIFSLNDGTAVKLTISNYFTPNGNNINGIGIEPDVEVELDAEKYNADGTDTQLNKAVEILNQKLGN